MFTTLLWLSAAPELLPGTIRQLVMRTTKPPEREIQNFQRKIREFYRRNRRDFAWRRTRDPYAVLVSEVMLQQTQTERVAEYFPRFLSRFPSFSVLAEAPLHEVLRAWQGLGYNRRAKHLWELSKIIVKRADGSLPLEHAELLALPGIGAYTAAALQVFIAGKRIPMLETNIRTVYLEEFFRSSKKVSDREVLALVHATMPQRAARTWFYALMDYGVYLKRTSRLSNRRSRHYRPQSRFEGSARQVRGAIVRTLLAHGSMTPRKLGALLEKKARQFRAPLGELVREGLVVKRGTKLAIPS